MSSTSNHISASFFPAIMLFAVSTAALGQTEPKSMKFEGAPSQTGTGALRCVANETAQFALIALDENLNRTLVHEYAPQARSTSEAIVVARVTDNAASTVNVLCVGDGEAWITVEAAGLRADMAVLVGKARSRATPKGPHPELAGAPITTSPGAVVTNAPQPVLTPPAVATSQSASTAVTTAGRAIPAPVQSQPESRAESRVSRQPAGGATISSAATAAPSAAEKAASSSQPSQAGIGPGPATASAYRTERIGASGISRGGAAVSRQANDPPAVHATGFKAFSGYGRINLYWKPVTGAHGYRIARASWDPVKLAWVKGSDLEFPKDPVSDEVVISRQVAEKKPGQYDGDPNRPIHEWQVLSESTWVAPAINIRTDTVVSAADSPQAWDTRVITTVSPRGVISDTTFVDTAVDPATQYVYWISSYFKSHDGTFYFPLTGPGPVTMATPRDPAGMSWLPSEAERASAPTLVQVVPSATGLFIEWVPKGGVVGYVIMRTRKDEWALQSYDKCYPYIIEFGGLIRHSNSVTLASFNSEADGRHMVKRFCVGIFAIYPETLIDGTPATYEFNNFNPSAYLKHHSMLESSVHSKGTFIWAEWDDSSGKWRLLPQGSFQINPCITGSYATAVGCW